MAGKKQKKAEGIKSALELALERFGNQEGRPPALSPEQKEALQEAEREIKAKIAELEILTSQRAAEAGARGDLEEVERLQQERLRETGRLGRLLERKKAAIRRGEIRNSDAAGP